MWFGVWQIFISKFEEWNLRVFKKNIKININPIRGESMVGKKISFSCQLPC